MLRIVPIVLAVIVCVSNLGFMGGHSANQNEIIDDHAPRNHLTQDKNAQAAPINEVYDFEDLTEDSAQEILGEVIQRDENILRLYWAIVPNAVKYEVLIDGATLYAYTNGIEIPIDDVHKKFQVNAISLDGTTLQNKIPIADIDTNPLSPRTTTEFDKMDYPRGYQSAARIITKLNL